MSSGIPYYHPSLVLGSIVDTSLLSKIKEINGLQMKTSTSKEKINSYVAMKRSLSMTINELISLGVDITDLTNKIKDIDIAIQHAATDYMTVCISNETNVQKLREEIASLEVNESLESPLDYALSEIKRLPISSDSLKLDAQYFSYGGNEEDKMASIENYIRESTRELGPKSDEVAKTASAQISRQKSSHNLAGTLIITASCTHKSAAVIEPFVLDVDKAVAIWNSLYPGSHDRIETEDVASMPVEPEEVPASDGVEKYFAVLSGVTYGSSFIGMVHTLCQEEMDAEATMDLAVGMEDKLKIGSWLEDAFGGFGIDAAISEEVRNLFSTQNVSSHVSLLTMGVVPSIASNQLKVGVSRLMDPGPERLKDYLNALETSTASSVKTVETGAAAAKAGAQLLNMQRASLQSVMQGLGKIDYTANKTLDINSMMTAFENYLEQIKSKDSNAGVPINFYVKKISKVDLLKLWRAKYYPNNGAFSPRQQTKGPDANETNE